MATKKQVEQAKKQARKEAREERAEVKAQAVEDAAQEVWDARAERAEAKSVAAAADAEEARKVPPAPTHVVNPGAAYSREEGPNGSHVIYKEDDEVALTDTEAKRLEPSRVVRPIGAPRPEVAKMLPVPGSMGAGER